MANANVVSWAGRSIMTNRLKGTGTEPLNIGWGLGTTTASASPDVNMFVPANTEVRTAGASTLLSTTQLADTYQVVGTITATGSRAITECGLFDTATSLSPQTNVASTMTAGATTASIGATYTSAFPAASNNYYAQIDNEIVVVTGGQGTSTLTITRGALGSTSATHTTASYFVAGGDGGAHAANSSIGSETWIPSGANGGSLFVHADFPVINLSTNDSIQFTLKIQLS